MSHRKPKAESKEGSGSIGAALDARSAIDAARLPLAGPWGRLWPVLIILCVQAGFLAVVYALAIAYEAPARLTGMDLVAPPSAVAKLRFHLERMRASLFGPGVGGTRLILESEEAGDAAPRLRRRVASAAVDDFGNVKFEVQASPAAGIHRFWASLEDPAGVAFKTRPHEVVLSVVPVERSFLMVAVPSALEDPSSPGGGAAEVLRDLTRTFCVVYVADPEAGATDEARASLVARGFPEAPVLGYGPWLPAPTVRDLMDVLALSRWKGRHWVICRQSRQAGEFALHGFRAVILRGGRLPQADLGGAGLEGKVFFSAERWPDVQRIVEQNR